MFTLHPENFGDFDLNNALEFVESWGQYYVDAPPYILGTNDPIVYIDELNIGNQLIQQNIIRLLRWKDPRMLTHIKRDGEINPRVQRVIEKIQDLNDFRDDQLSEEDFIHITGDIFQHGHVWRIFLFHIYKPSEYPIIDRYVRQAFCCHTMHNFNGHWSLEYAWDMYQQYTEYFNQIYEMTQFDHGMDNNVEHVINLKQIDNALMAFGQFLEKYGLG